MPPYLLQHMGALIADVFPRCAKDCRSTARQGRTLVQEVAHWCQWLGTHMHCSSPAC